MYLWMYVCVASLVSQSVLPTPVGSDVGRMSSNAINNADLDSVARLSRRCVSYKIAICEHDESRVVTDTIDCLQECIEN